MNPLITLKLGILSHITVGSYRCHNLMFTFRFYQSQFLSNLHIHITVHVTQKINRTRGLIVRKTTESVLETNNQTPL